MSCFVNAVMIDEEACEIRVSANKTLCTLDLMQSAFEQVVIIIMVI